MMSLLRTAIMLAPSASARHNEASLGAVARDVLITEVMQDHGHHAISGGEFDRARRAFGHLLELLRQRPGRLAVAHEYLMQLRLQDRRRIVQQSQKEFGVAPCGLLPFAGSLSQRTAATADDTRTGSDSGANSTSKVSP